MITCSVLCLVQTVIFNQKVNVDLCIYHKNPALSVTQQDAALGAAGLVLGCALQTFYSPFMHTDGATFRLLAPARPLRRYWQVGLRWSLCQASPLWDDRCLLSPSKPQWLIYKVGLIVKHTHSGEDSLQSHMHSTYGGHTLRPGRGNSKH